MRAILIPVKAFAASKMRLGPHFSAADRETLAAALCEDLFGTIAKVRVDRVYVMSSEPQALARAARLGN